MTLMLKTNRFLLISVLVGLVVVSSLLLLYRSMTTRALIEQEERANTNISYILANTILPRVENLLDQTESLDKIDFELVDRLVYQAVMNTSVTKVKIMNRSGMVLYSSDPFQVGESRYTNESFHSAIGGVPASSLSVRERFKAIHSELRDRHIIATHIPIRSHNSQRINGVFEIDSDVTHLFRTSMLIQLQIGIAVALCLLLIYLVLFKMARRADSVVNAQNAERLAAAERERYQAYHDQLTGLPNRVSFVERLDEALNRARREDFMVGVMYLDIDRFKMINDSFGHDEGDELLRLATRRLSHVIRESDLLFRMGGDEFTVIVERGFLPGDVAHLAQRILQAMREPIEIKGHFFMVTVSIGMSIYPKDHASVEQLVKNAEAAMYRSKQKGRNQYCFYTPEMNTQASERLVMESALQQAIGNDEFVLHYQPRVDSQTSDIVGAEALLRWDRPEHGMILPGEFIPILEDRELIVDVGEWVLRTAARQVREWLDMGLDPKRVSVNVSSRQFRKRNFINLVKSAIEEAGIPAGYIELELTESLLLDNSSHAIEAMRSLKSLGIKLSIDDFGTGYSSLNYLKLLPIDYLKIDRSFISDITSNARDVAIVNTITTLAEELGIEVVAEGVETRGQWEFLRGKYCQELQGYFFSRPVEASEIAQLLHRPRLASGQ